MMTTLVDWSDELSVGIQELDEQHKVLVGLVNELHDALLHRKGSAVTGTILARLSEYTRLHFVVEESLMRLLGYPFYEQHKEEHETLTAQLEEIKHKFALKKHSVSLELMQFLKLWLTKHIMETDKRYEGYFLAKGVEPRLRKPSWVDRLWQSSKLR